MSELGMIFAVNVAFSIVFAIFVVGFVGLAFVTIRWAIRRDRAGRVEWDARRQQRGGNETSPPGNNGR